MKREEEKEGDAALPFFSGDDGKDDQLLRMSTEPRRIHPRLMYLNTSLEIMFYDFGFICIGTEPGASWG